MLITTTLTTEYGGPPAAGSLEQLLADIADGDRDSLAELYSRTRAAVYGLALSVVKNAHEAQDVTQDTFVRVWESAPMYRPQGSPMAWLLTIARNLALMSLRRDSRQITLEEEEWNALPAQAPSVTPEDRHLLQSGLSVLTDEERQIVILHAVTGLKHREIADLLELPLATVLSKYHRSLKKLRNFMKGDEPL